MDTTTFSGRIDSKTRKTTLVDVAKALGLDHNRNGKELVVAIREHLDKHPRLAEDPRFTGLYAYRPDPKQRKKASKTSADKASEDLVEAEVSVKQRGKLHIICVEERIRKKGLDLPDEFWDEA